MVDITLEGQKFVLVFFRVVSVIWLLPLFQSAGGISAAYKAGLALLVAFLLFESVPAPDLHGDALLLLIAVSKEFLIGLAMGFFVRILFAAVSAAGEVVSMQSGLSFARAMDPVNMTQTTVLEQFMNMLAIIIFLGIDGHHILLRAVAASLKQIPPGAVAVRPALFQFLIESTGKIFGASLKICAPVIVTLFLMELALAILARLIPQVNVFVEGASMKILVTLTMLTISLNLMVPVIAGLFRGMDNEMLKIIRSAM
ncbi:MAG: flagellar biosynthetic protein FliR [Syntrophorhabdales bacterium]|jgi:flagellar biosynthetic protein FliR